MLQCRLHLTCFKAIFICICNVVFICIYNIVFTCIYNVVFICIVHLCSCALTTDMVRRTPGYGPHETSR